MQLLRDGCTFQLRDFLGVRHDRASDLECLAQKIGLRIGLFLQTCTSACICFARKQELFETLGAAIGIGVFEQLDHSRVPELADAMYQSVMTRHQHGEFAMIVRHPEAFAQHFQQGDAALLMTGVSRPFAGRRRSLPQIVRECGEAYCRVFAQARCLLQHHERMNAGIDLGMPLCRLWNAKQRFDLRKYDCQRAGCPQNFEVALRLRRVERPQRFLPHPLGNQRLQFAARRHRLHQTLGFRGDGKTQVRKARREAGKAQHAQGILDESRRNMPQYLGAQVAAAVEWIDDRAGFNVAGDGVDSQVAPLQVLLQCDFRRELRVEAIVPGAGFSFRARQGVFLAAAGVQEYGEILAHRTEVLIKQLLRRSSHHHPIALAHGQPQDFVANGAAHQIDFHRKSVADRARRWCASLLVMLTCGGLSGCYVLQAAQGQLALMSKRKPIAVLTRSTATPEPLRRRLEYVAAVREFASRELGLPDNKSYRSYADLKRRYVVWNVFAAPEFSVQAHRWCFPIVGCIDYRGYFRERAAERYARHMRARGYDATVGGVAAYSTLGHFADPVLNTMLSWSDAQLAGTVFHELAHQLLYVPGDSAFNEAFATAVEEAGIARWLERQHHHDDLQRWLMSRQREQRFIALLLEARERLKLLYQRRIPIDQMRELKQQEFGRLKYSYLEVKRSEWNGYAGYDSWFDRALNNADLIPIATYYACVPGFNRLLAAQEGNLTGFYAAAQRLAHLSKRERDAQLCGAGAG